MDFVVQPETGQRTVKCMKRDHTGVWVPADDSSIIADTAVGVAVAMTALTLSTNTDPRGAGAGCYTSTGQGSAQPIPPPLLMKLPAWDQRKFHLVGQKQSSKPFFSWAVSSSSPPLTPPGSLLVFLDMWLNMFPFWNYRSLAVNTMPPLPFTFIYWLRLDGGWGEAWRTGSEELGTLADQ